MSQYQEFSEVERQIQAVGELRGRAEALLVVLASRGIAVTKEVREAIVSCTDGAILDRWIRRAATAVSLDDVLTR